MFFFKHSKHSSDFQDEKSSRSRLVNSMVKLFCWFLLIDSRMTIDDDSRKRKRGKVSENWWPKERRKDWLLRRSRAAAEKFPSRRLFSIEPLTMTRAETFFLLTRKANANKVHCRVSHKMCRKKLPHVPSTNQRPSNLPSARKIKLRFWHSKSIENAMNGGKPTSKATLTHSKRAERKFLHDSLPLFLVRWTPRNGENLKVGDSHKKDVGGCAWCAFAFGFWFMMWIQSHVDSSVWRDFSLISFNPSLSQNWNWSQDGRENGGNLLVWGLNFVLRYNHCWMIELWIEKLFLMKAKCDGKDQNLKSL